MDARHSANEISINTLLEIFRRRKGIILSVMLLAAAGAILYSLLQPSRYRAEVFLSVEGSAAQDYVRASDPHSFVNVQEKLWLIRETLFSPSVMEQVMQEFSQSGNQAWQEKLAAWFWNTVSKTRLWFGLSPLENQFTQLERKKRQLEELKSEIKIQVEAADAFSIQFQGEGRQRVSDVANRLAELLVQRTSHASEQRASSATSFLEAETGRVKERLDEQNAVIRGYQQRIGDEQPGQVERNRRVLETLEAQVLAKKSEIADEQARRAAIAMEMKQLADQGVLEPDEASPFEVQLAGLRTHLEELQARYTAQHPEVKDTEAQLQAMEALAAASPGKSRIESSPARLRYAELGAEQEAAARRISNYQKQVEEMAGEAAGLRRKVESAPAHERTLAEMARDYEQTRAQYLALAEKKNQAQLEEHLNRSSQSTVFRIVRPAQLPLRPFAPQSGRIILLGLLSGLCIGFLSAAAAEYRDTTYDNAEELHNSTSLRVLAEIPASLSKPVGTERNSHGGKSGGSLLFLRKAPAAPMDRIVTLGDPRSISSEQYGLLAMQLRRLMGDGSGHVVTVTSAASGEGKTTVSINLGVMLSRTRPERVLLIEGDLRKSRMKEYLGLGLSRGLSGLLERPSDPLEPYLHRVGNLAVLPAGPALSDPLEALSSAPMRTLFSRLRREFQCIVVDSPPILPVADSRVLADLSDGVVLVVRAQQTRHELLQHALQSFNAPNIFGVVLNGVNLRRSPYASAYMYYTEANAVQGKQGVRTR